MGSLQSKLEAFYAFLDRPLFLWTRPLLVALLAPLAIGITLPLWHVSLSVPEHPGGLTFDIYAYTVKSGHGGADMQAINAIHQLFGMRTIDARALSDLDWLPFGFGVLALVALRVAALGNVRALVDLSAMVGYFAAFTLGRFAYALHGFGHRLSPDAAVPIPPFMPVMVGTQQVGEVTASAGPAAGAYLVAMFAVGVLAIAAFHLVEGRRRARRETAP